MSIISKETWDKFTQEEIKEIQKRFSEVKDTAASADCMMYELFGKENLQPQPLTYDDVIEELKRTNIGYVDERQNYFTSTKQSKKEYAIHKLLNVARFLNKDWKPDWSDEKQQKFSFIINQKGEIEADEYYFNCTFVYFPCPDYVYKAIQILGEDTVRLALGEY